MKRTLLVLAVSIMTVLGAMAQTYIEKLSRGVVVVPATKGNFISWRFLATDDPQTSFNVLRDGEVIAQDLTTATNFTDETGTPTSSYCVQTIVRGDVEETSDEVTPWAQPYLSVPLIRPSDDVTPSGETYSYTPNDCSAADVDGDGEYEIIVKWDPSNSRDNSHSGYTGEVYLDCYKTEGILLWRIALGKNIRAGAHYTQFMVYDLDGDGKAEVVCKTAPGTKDGKGNYITEAALLDDIRKAENTADYRNAQGHVLNGPEYLTVFAGKDGHAINTIYYNPNRAFGVGGAPDYATKEWGDGAVGNRGERYLACVAFLGGKTQNPSVVMCRGYYTCSYLWAVDFDGKELKTRWLHASLTPSEWQLKDANGKVIKEEKKLTATAYGQGAHSISVGDVDGDGCDEIIYGSAAINNDGALLYSTGLGHGDALHLSDLIPDRPGLEVYMPLESGKHGSNLHDARTGEILFRNYADDDTGRGMAADIDAQHRGCEMWSAAEKKIYNTDGTVITETKGWVPQNFRIYWDGDLQEELIGNGRMGAKPGTWGNDNSRRERGQRGNRNENANGESPRGPQGGDGQRGNRPPEGGEMPQRDGQGPRGNGQGPRDFGERGPRGDMRNDSTRQRPPMMDGQQGQQYYIAKWNGEGVDHVQINGKENLSDYGNSVSCNGTKATPCLQADLFGDWREEIVLYDAKDKSHLNIFTTTIPSSYRVVTLMQDHIYRMGVVWQNVSYNQPPHLGYYLPDLFK